MPTKEYYWKYRERYREVDNARMRRYRKEHPEKFKVTKEQRNEARNRYHHKHPDRVIYQRAKRRARLSSLEFDLEYSDIIIPEYCPILGIKIIQLCEAEGKQQDGSPALDRIDNTKGYVKGNVCVISHRANRIKSDGSAEEHEAIAIYMRKHIKEEK